MWHSGRPRRRSRCRATQTQRWDSVQEIRCPNPCRTSRRSSLASVDARRASWQSTRSRPQLEAPVDDVTIPKNRQNPRCFWLTAYVHVCTVVSVAGRDIDQVATSEPPAGCIPPPPVGSWNAGPLSKRARQHASISFASLFSRFHLLDPRPDRQGSCFQIAHSGRDLERSHLPGSRVEKRIALRET